MPSGGGVAPLATHPVTGPPCHLGAWPAAAREGTAVPGSDEDTVALLSSPTTPSLRDACGKGRNGMT